MVLGICRALNALHRYRVDETGSVKGAKYVRAEAVLADQEAEEEVDGDSGTTARRNRDRPRGNAMNGDIEQEPLMDDEVTISQEGVKPGEIRAYAHRDIKPGKEISIVSSTLCSSLR